MILLWWTWITFCHCAGFELTSRMTFKKLLPEGRERSTWVVDVVAEVDVEVGELAPLGHHHRHCQVFFYRSPWSQRHRQLEVEVVEVGRVGGRAFEGQLVYLDGSGCRNGVQVGGTAGCDCNDRVGARGDSTGLRGCIHQAWSAARKRTMGCQVLACVYF